MRARWLYAKHAVTYPLNGDITDAVGIRRRMLEKRNNGVRLFFMKTETSPGFEYNDSDHKSSQTMHGD